MVVIYGKGYNFIKGDILQSCAEAQVNPVNCIGVMGAGLAKEYKKQYPKLYKEYRKLCQNKQIDIGVLFVYHTGLVIPKYVINFPTKIHWRNPSKIDYIEIGLIALAQKIIELDINSIAIPALGCGLGGLNKKDVISLIIRHLPNDRIIEIYH